MPAAGPRRGRFGIGEREQHATGRTRLARGPAVADGDQHRVAGQRERDVTLGLLEAALIAFPACLERRCNRL